LPSIATTPAPGPWIATPSSISMSKVVSVMVPLSPAWNVITSSAPGSVLASRTAWRRLPSPASLRLVTLNVVASATGANRTVPPRAAPAAAVSFAVLSRRPSLR
jgi:hypothetical protein